MQYLEIIFWISLGIIFYTYVGYGLLLWVLVKLKERFGRKHPSPAPPADETLPELTLFIAAYNEEDMVDEKMANCLALDYPREKLHILWVTDGSTDATNERLAQWPGAEVLFQPLRLGKTAALNRGMREVRTPYVVFTDANTFLNRDALRHIVEAFRTDPRVGCVAGEKRVHAGDKANAAGLKAKIAKLDKEIQAYLPGAGKSFLIYHPALSYFARDYGLTQISIEEGGKEPSPAQLKALIARCKEMGVEVVFVQKEFDTRNAEVIANELRIPIVAINPLSYQWEREMRTIARMLSNPNEKP